MTQPKTLPITENLTEQPGLAADKRQQRATQRQAMDELYSSDREAVIVDGPPPPKEAFRSDRQVYRAADIPDDMLAAIEAAAPPESDVVGRDTTTARVMRSLDD
jgi:hypothetical protein